MDKEWVGGMATGAGNYIGLSMAFYGMAFNKTIMWIGIVLFLATFLTNVTLAIAEYFHNSYNNSQHIDEKARRK